MKKLCLALLLFCTIDAMSQKPVNLRLNLYANYVFDDEVGSYYSNTSYYEGKVSAGLLWGGGLEYMASPTVGVELVYLREDTDAPTTYYDNDGIGDPVKSTTFDLGINYILIGPNYYYPASEVFEPFLGFNLGVGIINGSNPNNGNEGSATKFAWSVKGGSNLWFSNKMGVKVQAGLASITQAVGGAIYFGGGGVSPGLSTYSTALQFSLGGGLVLKLGK